MSASQKIVVAADGSPSSIRALEWAIGQAALLKARLMVVGNRGHSGTGEALPGSVSQYLVHHAPCPVVVIRDGAARP